MKTLNLRMKFSPHTVDCFDGMSEIVGLKIEMFDSQGFNPTRRGLWNGHQEGGGAFNARPCKNLGPF